MTRLALSCCCLIFFGMALANEPTPALDALAARTLFEFPASSRPNAEQPRSFLRLAGTWQRCPSQWNGDGKFPAMEQQTWSGVTIPTASRSSEQPKSRQLLRTRLRIPDWLAGQSFHLKTPYFAGIESIWCDGRKLDNIEPWHYDMPTLSTDKPHELVIVLKPGTTLHCPEPPCLVATPHVYATSLWAKPDVAANRLSIEVTLHNAGDNALSVTLEANVYSMNRDGQIYEREPALKLPRETVTVPAHGRVSCSIQKEWPRARTWWPDEPNQYQLRVVTQLGNDQADRVKQTFAYCQWTVTDGKLCLNGMPYRLRTIKRSLPTEPIIDATQRLRGWQTLGQNLLLFDGIRPWVGSSVEETLQFLANKGMPTARIVPNESELMLNVIRHERANSGIAVWVLDLPGSAADVERLVEQVRAIDPTRPIVVRGHSVPETLHTISVATLRQWQTVRETVADNLCFLDLSTLRSADAEQLAIDARRVGCSITQLPADITDSALSAVWQPVVALEHDAVGHREFAEEFTRNITIFNDSRLTQSIELNWLFQTRDTRPIRQERGNAKAKLQHGDSQRMEFTITLKGLNEQDRLPCDFVLSCRTDHGNRSIRRATVELFAPLSKLSGTVQLWDPNSTLRNLDELVQVQRIDSPVEAFNSSDVLLVAPNAIDQPDDPIWNRLLNAGKRVVILPQDEPLHYPALPLHVQPKKQAVGPMQARIPESILWRGMRRSDLVQWPIAGETQQYRQPDAGTLRFLSAGDSTPLVGLTSGSGVTLHCQLPLGPSATHPVARRLIHNLIHLARDHRAADLSIVTPLPETHPWRMLLQQERFPTTQVDDLSAALNLGGIIVVEANVETLTQLAELNERIKAHMEAGGWLVFTNLTPEGLAKFNALVGEKHLIRNVASSSMIWNRPRNDVMLRLSDNALSLPRSPHDYVVSTDNLAPFLKGVESNPRHSLRHGKPIWNGEWDRPQTINSIQFRHPPGTRRILTMLVMLDGKRSRVLRLGAGDELQTFALAKESCRKITLQPLSWTDAPGDILGLDDLRIPTTTNATPWDQAGGIVAYPRGNGGFLLLQCTPNNDAEPSWSQWQQRQVARTILEQIGTKRNDVPFLGPTRDMRLSLLPLPKPEVPLDVPSGIELPEATYADALVFSQKFATDNGLSVAMERPAAWYRIRYVDGDVVELPIRIDVADQSTAIHKMQWTNPYPGVAIASIEWFPDAEFAKALGRQLLLGITLVRRPSN